MNSEPLSLSSPTQGHGQARGRGGRRADALLALAPDGLQLDPRGGDIDGAEGAEVEALGARAAVGDQIDLQEARLGIVPLGEGANGDLVLEPSPGPRGGGAAPRAAWRGPGPRGARAWAAGLPDELVDGRGDASSPHRARRSSSSGTKGCRRWAPMCPGPPTGPPRRGHLGPVRARAAARAGGARGRGARRSSRMAALRCSR